MSPRILWLSALALAATGCFDDAKLRPLDAGSDIGPSDVPVAPPDAQPDAPATDAAADIDDVLDAADVAEDTPAEGGADASDAPPADSTTAECMLDRVLVTTSDFRTGGYALGRFAPMPSLVERMMAMAPDQDHLPVQSGCVVYELLRGNDELAVLDVANLPATARRVPLRPMMSTSTDPYQSNPWDVLTVSPTKAYVAMLAQPRLAVVDPTRGGREAVTGAIDLSPLRVSADRDMSGSPEPSAIVRAGRYVFVALQHLNAFAPVANGTLAVINPADDRLVDADVSTTDVEGVSLAGRNPVAMQLTPGGRLVVGMAGVVATMAPQMLDGGIEVVDPFLLRGRGLRITEAQLGGDLSNFVMLDDARGWAVVTQLMPGAPTMTRVVEFDLDAGDGMRVGRTIVSTGSIAAIARDPSGNVWVLDRTPMRAGARVFNPMGMELTTAPLTTGSLPPLGIAFVP